MNDLPLDAEAPTSPPDPLWRRALDNPWLMVGMLFFVTAICGLPFLWMSRGFSTLSKILLTIAVLAWTALMLWLVWLVIMWAYDVVQSAGRIW